MVGLLSLVAAARVFLVSAAFPLFNNVDEHQHFDLVVKYSEGHVPGGLEPYARTSAEWMLLYQSPEYVRKPEMFPEGKFPPPLAQWGDVRNDSRWPQLVDARRQTVNYQSTEWPLYYALAGGWLRLGEALGLSETSALFWIRWLNVPLVAGLVWVGFVAARQAVPDRPIVVWGTPALLALFPQDIFYSIQSDALSPLMVALAYLAAVRWLRVDAPSFRLAVCTGLALAGAALVKLSNGPLVAVIGLGVIWHTWRRHERSSRMVRVGVLGICAALPVGWLVRNRIVLGDWTGSAAKTAHFQWTRKPLAEWFSHPLFSPRGLYDFTSELAASFWRGEFVWHTERLAWAPLDAWYWLSSLAFPAVTVVYLVRNPQSLAARVERGPLWLAIAVCASGVAFLAALSLAFDFAGTTYPSREFPYFTSGRLLSGALVPFCLLYLFGLDIVLSWLPWQGERLRFAVLAVLLAAITASEIILSSPAFASAYNWYHW